METKKIHGRCALFAAKYLQTKNWRWHFETRHPVSKKQAARIFRKQTARLEDIERKVVAFHQDEWKSYARLVPD